MKKPFKGMSRGLTSPLTDAVEITPSDSNDLPAITRAVFVGVPGDIQVTMMSGTVVTLSGASAGWHPLRITRVWQTGTTAQAICGGW